MVLKLKMDFFLIKTQCFRRPLLTPWSCMDYFYDGWMHFLGVQNLRHHSLPLQSLEELGSFLIKRIVFA